MMIALCAVCNQGQPGMGSEWGQARMGSGLAFGHSHKEFCLQIKDAVKKTSIMSSFNSKLRPNHGFKECLML